MGRRFVWRGSPDSSFPRVSRPCPCFRFAFTQSPPPQAPTGFDDLTNGLISRAAFDLAREVFDEREEIADGIGPVYNAPA
jgi:hypothetical protein